MYKVRKNKVHRIAAYRLGTDEEMLKELEKQGKLKPLGDGSYEVMSRESKDGKGQIAHAGDYIKVDSAGFPYPNEEAFFLKKHRHIEGNIYEQIPEDLWAWDFEEPECQEINYLIRNKKLKICEENPAKYYSAELWGTLLSAPRDAVIVFYSLEYDEVGNIIDVEFNFVHREEFQKTYSRVC